MYYNIFLKINFQSIDFFVFITIINFTFDNQVYPIK